MVTASTECIDLGLFREWCGELDCLSLWHLNRRGACLCVLARRQAACCAPLGVRDLVGQGRPFDGLRTGPAPTRNDSMHTVRHDPTRLQQCRRVRGRKNNTRLPTRNPVEPLELDSPSGEGKHGHGRCWRIIRPALAFGQGLILKYPSVTLWLSGSKGVAESCRAGGPRYTTRHSGFFPMMMASSRGWS